jgi:hypothetical protein
MRTEVQRRAGFRGTLAFVVILLACVAHAGFFLQIGLGFWKGDFPNPNLALQCGYLFELR